MELRIAGARATKDIDVTFRGGAGGKRAAEDAGVLRDRLQQAAALDLQDGFSFLIGEPTMDLDGPPYGGALPAFSAVLLAGGAPVTLSSAVSLFGIFGVFLKAGALLFGSGYVLLAFLRADLVERLHWLTESQLIDAIAVGQVTPGPVFTTATFVGYMLAGPAGASIATVGIFLPAFFFVAASGPLIPRLRASKSAASFLDGVNVAALALMVVVTLQLARATFVDVPTVVLGASGAFLLLRYKVNSTWLIVGGAVAGSMVHIAGLHT